MRRCDRPSARVPVWAATGVLVVAGAVTLAAAAAQTRARGDAADVPSGQQLYRTYCASCHGLSGRGDGPVAAELRRPLPDLTTIARREGVFPRDRVFMIIEGRQRVAGHGGPEMPVWGDVFRRSTPDGDSAVITARIQALVDYLHGIQVRAGP